TPLLAIALWRFGQQHRIGRLGFVVGALTVIAVVHVVIKVKTGYGQVPGAESDVVFNYPMFSPAAEDVVSNALTHLYTVITGFLPASFVSSSALYNVGAQR